MNELEKIQIRKEEIKKHHEKIKRSMFLLVQMVGGEVKPANNRIYTTIGDTGIKFVVESFVIKYGKLMVNIYLNGGKFTLELDSFIYTDNLEKVFCTMLKANKMLLQHKIENMFKAYCEKHNEEPIYALCGVKFLNDSGSMNVTIKLSLDPDEGDDNIFYYCDSLSDLKSLCDFGVGDFILTDVYEFSNEI